MNKDIRLTILLLGFASLTVFTLFLWQGNKGFNLWDEGYLWYGAQRVMLGEVPKLDFKAYDPGRYYWAAALMSLWGDNGIMALRVAVAIFQAIGLFVGILVIARSMKKQNYLYLLLSATTLAVWMFPRQKLFDITLSILLVSVLAFLVQNPTSRRYFVTGLCLGFIAVFGRNHGIYGVAGCLGVMWRLGVNRADGTTFLKGGALLAGGVVIGYMPIVLMALQIENFAIAFMEGLLHQVERGSTNLPLPVPWPWKVNFVDIPIRDSIHGVLVGLFFISPVVFGIVSIAGLSWQRFHNKQVSPAFVAASFLSLPYAHYIYSRADLNHLAQGIFPLLIGCLVFLSTREPKFKWPLAVALCGTSLWCMHFVHPGWQCRPSNDCVNVEISGSSLQVDAGTANDIALLRQLVEQYAPNDQSFIATPFWPGAYSLLSRKSPMWEIYALFPQSETFERREIERINAAKPGFAIVFDLPLDGREELRFRNTHPLIHQYILDNFESVPHSHNPAYQIYKANSESKRKK